MRARQTRAASRSTGSSILPTIRRFLSSATSPTSRRMAKQIPGVAQPAMQMGDYAAKRIKLTIEGRAQTQKPFRYFDKGDMATIGRKAAVARIAWPFKAHWSGFMAWLTWLVVHHFLSHRVPQPASPSSVNGLSRTSAFRTVYA